MYIDQDAQVHVHDASEHQFIQTSIQLSVQKHIQLSVQQPIQHAVQIVVCTVVRDAVQIVVWEKCVGHDPRARFSTSYKSPLVAVLPFSTWPLTTCVIPLAICATECMKSAGNLSGSFMPGSLQTSARPFTPVVLHGSSLPPSRPPPSRYRVRRSAASVIDRMDRRVG